MIAYFAWKLKKPVSKLYLLKMVYLANRYHLRKFARPVYEDEYFAMDFGPVATSAKRLIEGITESELLSAKKQKGVHMVSALASPRLEVFSESDREAMDVAIRIYESKRSKIVDYTHRFPEWKRFQEDLRNGSRRKKMFIVDFFESAGAAEYCNVQSDIVAINKEVFLENEELKHAFA